MVRSVAHWHRITSICSDTVLLACDVGILWLCALARAHTRSLASTSRVCPAVPFSAAMRRTFALPCCSFPSCIIAVSFAPPPAPRPRATFQQVPAGAPPSMASCSARSTPSSSLSSCVYVYAEPSSNSFSRSATHTIDRQQLAALRAWNALRLVMFGVLTRPG